MIWTPRQSSGVGRDISAESCGGAIGEIATVVEGTFGSCSGPSATLTMCVEVLFGLVFVDTTRRNMTKAERLQRRSVAGPNPGRFRSDQGAKVQAALSGTAALEVQRRRGLGWPHIL